MRKPGSQEDRNGVRNGHDGNEWEKGAPWAKPIKSLACFVSFVVIFAGCAGTPEQEVGIRAPVTVATNEGDVDVHATTVTEAEALSAGAVKADTARDIRTFGLDEGTRALLSSALSGFWKQTGVITCIVFGVGLFLLTVKLDIPESYRIPLMAAGLAVAAIPVLKWALLT